jgi:hypothetical protein
MASLPSNRWFGTAVKSELVAPSVCEIKSTGSILNEAMRGPSNPRTTRIKMKALAFSSLSSSIRRLERFLFCWCLCHYLYLDLTVVNKCNYNNA